MISNDKFIKYAKNLHKDNVDTLLVSVWTTEKENPLELIKLARKTIDSINTKGTKLLLHIEDAHFIDKNNVQEIIEQHPFSVGITWNAHNGLGGGAFAEGGLTTDGEDIIRTLIQQGIVIDLAHMNRPTFTKTIELLQEYRLKPFCSHTCIDSMHNHPRCLTNTQIGAIVEMDGLVGLTLVGCFLTDDKPVTMQHVYEHIKYFMDTFGDGNLAIGTDFFGTDELPQGLESYSDFKNFRKFLKEKGLKDTSIDKLFYENAKRYIDNRYM